MTNDFFRGIFLFIAAMATLLVLPATYLFLRPPSASEQDPIRILNQYLKAAYARDFRRAYRFISSEDQRLKNEKTYIRERGAFNGFTLQVARRLADFIEATPIEKKITGSQAHIKLKLKLPDANKLSPLLLQWDEDRLNALPVAGRKALIEMLDKRRNEGKLDTIQGEETFELVKEKGGWRLFLHWAAGVRISFAASVPPSNSFAAEPVQKEVLIQPGELFTIAYRVKNLSGREVSTRIAHRILPKEMAEYLDIVECGLLFPVRLSPGEKEEYSTTYQIRGDLPEGVRRLAVTYEFMMDER